MEDEPSNKNGFPNLSDKELRQAFDNIGKQHLINDLHLWYLIYQERFLQCGACAGLFFTGYGAYPHDDKCTLPKAEPLIVEVSNEG